MRSRHYMAIFVATIAVVGGLIWYNASTIQNIDDEVVTIKNKPVTTKEDKSNVQEDINVLTDVDFDADADDLVEPENLSDLDATDELVADEEVVL